MPSEIYKVGHEVLKWRLDYFDSYFMNRRSLDSKPVINSCIAFPSKKLCFTTLRQLKKKNCSKPYTSPSQYYPHLYHVIIVSHVSFPYICSSFLSNSINCSFSFPSFLLLSRGQDFVTNHYPVKSDWLLERYQIILIDISVCF